MCFSGHPAASHRKGTATNIGATKVCLGVAVDVLKSSRWSATSKVPSLIPNLRCGDDLHSRVDVESRWRFSIYIPVSSENLLVLETHIVWPPVIRAVPLWE
jgi:hypothetical protein